MFSLGLDNANYAVANEAFKRQIERQNTITYAFNEYYLNSPLSNEEKIDSLLHIIDIFVFEHIDTENFSHYEFILSFLKRKNITFSDQCSSNAYAFISLIDYQIYCEIKLERINDLVISTDFREFYENEIKKIKEDIANQVLSITPYHKDWLYNDDYWILQELINTLYQIKIKTIDKTSFTSAIDDWLNIRDDNKFNNDIKLLTNTELRGYVEKTRRDKTLLLEKLDKFEKITNLDDLIRNILGFQNTLKLKLENIKTTSPDTVELINKLNSYRIKLERQFINIK